ncbi:MAG: hypothetical protein BWY32_02193 [bacterium ADurb.Bin243]|nr:MAG: hypothetical protein BWY32_02193 [bacterium ADurb.Bin243]
MTIKPLKIYNGICIKRFFGILLTAITLFSAHAFFYRACEAAAGDSEMEFKRNILVYYSASNGSDDYSNDVFELFGIFFNYYGYNFTFHNLDEGIGDEKIRESADLYVVCQYEAIHKHAGELCDFLTGALGRKRIILMELPGAPGRQEKLIEKLGFDCRDFIKGDLIRSWKGDSGLASGEIELKLTRTSDYFMFVPKPDRADARVHLAAVGDSVECPLIASSKDGAIIFTGKILAVDEKFNRRWMIDPMKAAGLLLSDGNRFVVPDPLVQSGRRAAFIHIDGDGFNYKTEHNDERYSGEIIADEIIDRYKLPTTASLIVSEVHPNDFGNAALEKKAAELLKKPYVEPASHSWYHPFEWHRLKLDTIEKYSDDTAETDQIQEMKIYNPANRIRETCLEKEIVSSVKYIGDLSGRKCRVICWTGMCNPTREALKLCEDKGIYNINGGDTRYDGEFKLYSNLRPHYCPSGGRIKFNARYVNEFIMTEHWSEPYDNYKKVIEGFKNTASPYLLTPVNIYYHFYSGTKPESLAALKEVYEFALAQSFSFMSVSAWIERLRGFMNCRITALRPVEKIELSAQAKPYYDAAELKCLYAYRYENNGEMDNFRWDFEGYPMIDPSGGVMGFNEINGSKYINAGPNKSGNIFIVDRPPEGLYLKSLSGKVIVAGYDSEEAGVYNVEAFVNSPFKAVIANADYPFYKIYYTNAKNETVQYAAIIDKEKNELIFNGPYEAGKIKLSIHYSSHFGNIKSFFYGAVTRIYYFFMKNPLIILLLVIYAYFSIQNRYLKRNLKRPGIKK